MSGAAGVEKGGKREDAACFVSSSAWCLGLGLRATEHGVLARGVRPTPCQRGKRALTSMTPLFRVPLVRTP